MFWSENERFSKSSRASLAAWLSSLLNIVTKRSMQPWTFPMLSRTKSLFDNSNSKATASFLSSIRRPREWTIDSIELSTSTIFTCKIFQFRKIINFKKVYLSEQNLHIIVKWKMNIILVFYMKTAQLQDVF